ncbi:MAG: DUF3105 domain-containing protein [Actinomycetota bacterium]|nr:DUF3105 domain-containing protein [Actinomycetota bacterium]
MDGKEQPRKRLILAFATVLAIAALGLVLVGCGGGGDDTGGGGDAPAVKVPADAPEGSAHINPRQEIGLTNGVRPDEREGTPPKPPQVTDLREAADRAGCRLMLHLRDEGHLHLPPNSPPKYKTNPPTSGNHVEPPYQQADGAYAEPPDQLNVVHSLEHGRLAIQYKPSLPEKEQLELKGLYDTMYGATLLFPNGEMPYEVAATTWTNLIGCPRWEGQKTLDAIRAFGKETWGRYGGEPVEAFTFDGPTPAEPEEPAVSE